MNQRRRDIDERIARSRTRRTQRIEWLSLSCDLADARDEFDAALWREGQWHKFIGRRIDTLDSSLARVEGVLLNPKAGLGRLLDYLLQERGAFAERVSLAESKAAKASAALDAIEKAADESMPWYSAQGEICKALETWRAQ